MFHVPSDLCRVCAAVGVEEEQGFAFPTKTNTKSEVTE